MTANKSTGLGLIWPVKLLLGLSVGIAAFSLYMQQWNSQGPVGNNLRETGVAIADRFPDFLHLPATWGGLFIPVAISLILSVILRFVPLSNGTRFAVKAVLLVFNIRYLVWRTFATLNFSTTASTTLSLLLYGAELLYTLCFWVHSFQTIGSNDQRRSREANVYSQAIISGDYQPTVDVLIPTYNEPEHIVRRTVVGCQNLDYPHKTIYILDDTRRPQIKALAAKLGCEYITRPDNQHAKAGNLNHALPQLTGELVTVFDADFVPMSNFLTRTVGFFQRSAIAMVQTPQYFYNPDYYARNLGVAEFMPNDMEFFYGFIQPSRDFANSVICCGSSYVVRRSALDEVGGYCTLCCVEDYQTSLTLLMQGKQLVYLNEVLSTGESTRTYADFIDQRLRWMQGNWQVYFCGAALPIWRKLNWVQQSFLVSQYLHCIQPFTRLIFLLMPIVYLYTGIVAVNATVEEALYFFMPSWLLGVAVQSWITDYRCSQLWFELHEVTFCFPAIERLLRLFINPFAKVSKVTRKGVRLDRKNYNLGRTWPLLLLSFLSLFGVALNYVGQWLGWWIGSENDQLFGYFWLGYNALLMFVSFLSSIDQPVRRQEDRFPITTECDLRVGDTVYHGKTIELSENGASLKLYGESNLQTDAPITLELAQHHLAIPVRVTHYSAQRSVIGLRFLELDLPQQRRLVHLLYCDMNWWKWRRKPGSLDMVISLFTAAVKMRPVWRQYRPIKTAELRKV
jgi:cellulose synthase (UDP-forming)